MATRRNGCVSLLDPFLHSGQVEALAVIEANRFTVLRNGRRWGKTRLIESLIIDAMLCGKDTGYFSRPMP
jgi:hypothetical protein